MEKGQWCIGKRIDSWVSIRKVKRVEGMAVFRYRRDIRTKDASIVYGFLSILIYTRYRSIRNILLFHLDSKLAKMMFFVYKTRYFEKARVVIPV